MTTIASGNIRSDGLVTAAGKGAVCLPSAEKNAQFRKLKALRENQTCFDCPNTRPTWASVTYGAYLDVLHSSVSLHMFLFCFGWIGFYGGLYLEGILNVNLK